ncbi:TetR/AcrR family transcriptional regulator [Kocuria soli]|uniref:TetR/AcrR family transcriptional regulator n=1 Tax=Kocuria soli TaxID=2485125 RepID=A0A3N4A849_9MICC|nr:TetR/AcrR family transcriptional regulator [Kocuria soli]ROZ65735.1 TetR/AcrR family transcriptional regulator [Kocuria soli]
MTSTHSPVRRGRPGYDREQLLQVCVQVFNEHGYDATSMGKLAEELGITKSAIYHHVASKEELLELALNRALDALEAEYQRVQDQKLDAVDQLEAVLRGTVRVLVEQMPYVTLLLRLRGNSEVEMAALQRRRQFTRQLGELITRAQEDGQIRQDVSAVAAPRLLLGMVNSLVDWYRPTTIGSADVVADTVAKIALDGLRGPTDSR